MSKYHEICDKCGDETITYSWSPSRCPFCELAEASEDKSRLTSIAMEYKQQRDRLAEALRFVVDDLDFEITERIGYSHHWCSLQVAREALAAVEGGSHEAH